MNFVLLISGYNLYVVIERISCTSVQALFCLYANVFALSKFMSSLETFFFAIVISLEASLYVNVISLEASLFVILCFSFHTESKLICACKT